VTLIILNLGRAAAGCVLVFCLLQLLLNLILTYSGYDPKTFFGRWVLRKRWSIGLAVLAFVVLHGANIHLERLMDRGPFQLGMGDLVGTWQEGDSRFRLNDDGTLEFLGASSGGEDTLSWRIAPSGDGLEIRDGSGTLMETWRIIRFDDEYRILQRYDTTTWSPPAKLGFSQVSAKEANK
jgi:hypothetical protein